MGRKVASGIFGPGSTTGTGFVNITGNTIGIAQTNSNLILDANGTGVVTTPDVVTITNNSTSTSTGTGALRVTGGMAIGGDLWIGGTINGGSGINNTAIGSSTPSSGSFTALTASGLATLAELSEISLPISGASGVVNHDFTATNIWVHSSMAGNFTVNLQNVPTTNDRNITINLILLQGSTARFASAFQIDGAAQTIRWASYAPPTPQANRFEIQSFTLIRSASAWTVLSGLTSFG
jgi:hypothetical protein